MKTLLFFIVLFAVLWLWDSIRGGSDEAAERIEKDEKYSFKKMNAEINKKKEIEASAHPKAVLMATDEYHLEHFGKAEDGSILWIGSQLKYNPEVQDTSDYIFKFIFEASGDIIFE